MDFSYKRVPLVREERCVGCGICSDICPHDCLEIVDGVTVLTRPEACTSDASCVFACPRNALRLAPAKVLIRASKRVSGIKV